MIQLTAPKGADGKVTGRVAIESVTRGHWARPSGAGRHQDRRTKRQRTRGASLRANLKGD